MTQRRDRAEPLERAIALVMDQDYQRASSTASFSTMIGFIRTLARALEHTGADSPRNTSSRVLPTHAAQAATPARRHILVSSGCSYRRCRRARGQRRSGLCGASDDLAARDAVPRPCSPSSRSARRADRSTCSALRASGCIARTKARAQRYQDRWREAADRY